MPSEKKVYSPAQGNFMCKMQTNAFAAENSNTASVGHYFDQAVFDLHYQLQVVRARALMLGAEHRDLFVVDELGNVKITDRE